MSARYRLTLCAAALLSFAFAASGQAQDEAEAGLYAQRHFERGNALLAEGDTEAALVSFQRSYALSQSPNAMLYIGRCLRSLERYAEAAESFDIAALSARLRGAEEPRYLETSQAAQGEREALAPRVGTVVIVGAGLQQGMSVLVQGREIGAERFDLPIPVEPGEVEVRGTVDGTSVRRVVSVAAGEEVDIRLATGDVGPSDLDPSQIGPHADEPPHGDPLVPDPPGTPSRRTGWLATSIASGALGVAGLSVGFVYAAAANRRFDSLSESCSDGICPPGHEAEIEEGRRFDRNANIGLIAGGLALAVGVTALIIWLARDRSPSDASAAIHF